jgi:hypothetical protein|tara:strand:+ start:838 stop:1233 length:396 start_codon:yes stop_codon:yes gene_type:complete
MDYKNALKKFISEDNKQIPSGFVVLSKDKPYVPPSDTINSFKKRTNEDLDVNASYESLREESIKSLLSEEIQSICDELIEENIYFDNPMVLKDLFINTWNLLEKNIKMKIIVKKEEEPDESEYLSDYDIFD